MRTGSGLAMGAEVAGLGIGATLMRTLAAAMACLLLASCFGPPRVGGSGIALGLLVPAYFDPDRNPGDWQRIEQAAARVPVVAIMNPDNGPGSETEPDYQQAIAAVHGAAGYVVGYVESDHGSRDLSTVEAEVDAYYARYAVDGIFIDEMDRSADASVVSYYQQLAAYIRAHHSDALIIANPGTSFDEAFAQARVAEIFVDQESSADRVNAATQKPWTQRYPRSMFAEIATGADDDAAEVGVLAPRHIGWVYSTTLSESSNPYQALPSDFEAEVAKVAEVNASR